MNELKNLKADGLTVLGASLKHAFDLLNMNRMQTGIDTYGQVSRQNWSLILGFLVPNLWSLGQVSFANLLS